jgi:amidase
MRLDEYVKHDATGLAELVRKGETTAAELADCANEAIERTNGDLNFIAERLETPVPGDAAGPLAGVPFLCKDLVLHIEGIANRSGSRMLAAGQLVPPASSELFKRFQKLGLNTVGITTTPEFGFNGATEALLYGPTRSPWDTTRSPGGSSGGSAAAVAAGVVPVAHGNDGGGSLRIPAANCNLVGLKPTRGRTPLGPDYSFPLMGMGIEFALTRSIRDCALMLDHVQGPEVGAMFDIPAPAHPYAQAIQSPTRKLRIAMATHLPGTPEPDAPGMAALMETAQLLRDMGHEVIEAMPHYDVDGWRRANFVFWCGFLASGVFGLSHMLGIAPGADNVEAATMTCALAGKDMTALDYELAMMQSNAVNRALGAFMTGYDAFLLPLLRHPPVEIGRMNQNDATLSAQEWHDKIFDVFPYCGLFNMTGQPAISLPAGLRDGLPSAVQVVAPMGDEATLLQIGRDLEQARPWARDRPAVFAGAMA